MTVVLFVVLFVFVDDCVEVFAACLICVRSRRDDDDRYDYCCGCCGDCYCYLVCASMVA